MLNLEPTLIRNLLVDLSRSDPDLEIFGSKGHRYHLNQVLTEKQIEVIEAKYRMRLPEDYRRFLLEVGNGGAGPFYGVFKLGEHDSNHGFCSWDEGGLIGDLAKMFPHTTAWNLPSQFFDQQPNPDLIRDAKQEEEEQLKWDRKMEEAYWAPSIMDGSIPICHLGCAQRHWLVVTGPEAGHVWADLRPDDDGIKPLSKPGQDRLTFGEWYMDWLHDALHQAR